MTGTKKNENIHDWIRIDDLLFVATWNFNGKPLDRQSSRFVFIDGSTEFSLEIPIVLATDEGQYHVTVANDKGEITAAFSLHVDQSWNAKDAWMNNN